MRIKELLREHNMTQKDLANRLGVAEASVSRTISGRYAPTLDTLERIADAIGVDVAELFAPTIRCPHCGRTIVLPHTDK